MRRELRLPILGLILILGVMLLSAGLLLAQTAEPEPAACELRAEMAEITTTLADIDSLTDAEALALLYQAGAAYQALAARCGYAPTQEEREALADFVLSLVDLPTILARNTVGTDVAAILVKLAEVPRDPIRGQLLYNDLAPVTDGATLGCVGCHGAEGDAPPTEGTWTRVTEIRLADPALEGYTFEQYIVESIIQTDAYIVPGHSANQMPAHFGQRLTLEELADLVAYLESQDQFLDESG